jgi:hypothetical protein
MGFTPRFDAGAPEGPRQGSVTAFVGLYLHPTCQGRVHVPVSYLGASHNVHLKLIL